MGSGGGAWAAQMQSPCGGCLEAVLLHRPRCNEHNTVRGLPLQARVVAAYGAVSQLANMLLVAYETTGWQFIAEQRFDPKRDSSEASMPVFMLSCQTLMLAAW